MNVIKGCDIFVIMEQWKQFKPLIEKAKLEIIKFGLDRKDSFAAYGRTFHFYGVSYMSQGRSVVRFENKVVEYGPGDAFLISPGMKHDHIQVPGEQAIFLWWNFTYDIAGCIDALRVFDLPNKVRMKNVERFCAVFNDYLRCADKPSGLADLMLSQARALEMVSLILGEAFDSEEFRIRHGALDNLGSLVEDISQFATSRNLLKVLSEKHNLNPTYLSNRFTEAFGVPPSVLQRSIRLQLAKDMLKTGSLSVGDVAAQLGYENANNFTRFFKQSEGMSPLAYRKLFQNQIGLQLPPSPVKMIDFSLPTILCRRTCV